jgi:hypothetical protein
MPPVGFFFFACPGFFPFDPFLYCLNPSVLHVTLRSMLPSLQQTQQTDIHAPGGIRTRNPSKRAAVDPCLRPHGHCDWWIYIYVHEGNLHVKRIFVPDHEIMMCGGRRRMSPLILNLGTSES